MIAWGPPTSHLHIHYMHLISTMTTEKKACKPMETVAIEVQEGEEKSPYSSQSLGRKSLRAANRKLMGWELYCQPKVSKGLMF